MVGLRFTGLDLPRHAVITEAWVQFTVAHRPRTTATVPWAPDPWTDVGSAGPASRTPDLTAVVQELVHEPGWDPASALALVLSGTGHRTAAAEEHATLDPPSLHVAYLPPTPDVGVDARVGLPADDAEEAPTGIVTRVTRDLYPVSHQRVFGTVAGGGVLALPTSDNQRMALREELGSGANPNSLLEFRFPLAPLPTFQSLTLVVEAHHTVNTEGDDLLVDWSRNGGPWHPLVTVTKTADNGTAQFKLLPTWINAGDVLSLRVRDANRTPGRRQLDTAHLDRLFLRAVVPA